MLTGNIFPESDYDLGIRSLLSNDNMLTFFKKFCDAITSRIWKIKRGKNSRYRDIDFLEVFFFSEVLGRSIHETSELLNNYAFSRKRGRRKIFADGRRKREIPH